MLVDCWPWLSENERRRGPDGTDWKELARRGGFRTPLGANSEEDVSSEVRGVTGSDQPPEWGWERLAAMTKSGQTCSSLLSGRGPSPGDGGTAGIKSEGRGGFGEEPEGDADGASPEDGGPLPALGHARRGEEGLDRRGPPPVLPRRRRSSSPGRRTAAADAARWRERESAVRRDGTSSSNRSAESSARTEEGGAQMTPREDESHSRGAPSSRPEGGVTTRTADPRAPRIDGRRAPAPGGEAAVVFGRRDRCGVSCWSDAGREAPGATVARTPVKSRAGSNLPRPY